MGGGAEGSTNWSAMGLFIAASMVSMPVPVPIRFNRREPVFADDLNASSPPSSVIVARLRVTLFASPSVTSIIGRMTASAVLVSPAPRPVATEA